MMSYILTQQDIEEYNFSDAIAGDVATLEELKMMGMTTAPVDPTAGGLPPDVDPTYVKTRNKGGSVAEAVMDQDPTVRAGANIATDPSLYARSAASSMGGSGGASSEMMDLLSKPIPQDPFEGLSRNQRMMLGFAAMKDAGMVLMGKDSNSVSAVMGDFNERADMERKRRAAVAGLKAEERQRAALMGMLGAGPSVAGSAPPTDVEGLRAKRKQLTTYMAVNPDAAAGLVPTIQQIDADIERIEGAQQSLISTNMGIAAVDALINSPDLGKVTGIRAFGNQWLEQINAAPEYSNLMSYVDQIRGLNFLEAYQTLKGGGPITDIEGSQATAARTRVDRALKGTPRDLVAALEEVRVLFEEARSKNPLYKAEVAAGDGPAPTAAAPTFTKEEIDEYLIK